jgi:hypothetical protein
MLFRLQQGHDTRSRSLPFSGRPLCGQITAEHGGERVNTIRLPMRTARSGFSPFIL